MRVFLVRHGETDWNRERRLQGRTDIPLNATGLAQAEAAARLLTGVDAVVSSPLARARRTGEIVARVLHLPAPALDERLVERCYGAKEGLTPAEVARTFPPGQPVPGLEPVEDLRARALAALDDLSHQVPADASVAVTTHGAVIRAVVTGVAPGVADTLDVPIHNGSVHVFDWDARTDLRGLVEFGLVTV
ncbi:histidine phosphatase family protein [Cellulomonas sp. H30R-01]|uniref:histidine phosphatase family protein n=1 Tax=Cellulomonas sp. H30R-01 TaxID=2704467 RepID=UPI00138B84D2|nr:histidine phosphatase family protein [Cellulomonas sp. H30R-01]QHT57569.1 histidine phosphatase family protein [Cellulomonas sp. H30R-01]